MKKTKTKKNKQKKKQQKNNNKQDNQFNTLKTVKLWRFIHISVELIFFRRHSALPALVAQLTTRPTGDQEVAGLTPPGQQHYFVEILP